jgi:muramidase (phage lysozyme)
VYVSIQDVSLPAAPSGILYPAFIGLGTKSKVQSFTLTRGQIDTFHLSVVTGMAPGDSITIGTIVRKILTVTPDGGVLVSGVVVLTEPLTTQPSATSSNWIGVAYTDTTVPVSGTILSIPTSSTNIDLIVDPTVQQVIAVAGTIQVSSSTGASAILGNQYSYSYATHPNAIVWSLSALTPQPAAGSQYTVSCLVEKEASDYVPTLSVPQNFATIFGPAVQQQIVANGLAGAGSSLTQLTDTTQNFTNLGVYPGHYVRFDQNVTSTNNAGQIRQVLYIKTTTNPSDTLVLATAASGDLPANPASTSDRYTVTDLSDNSISMGGYLAAINSAPLLMGAQMPNDTLGDFTNALTALQGYDPYVIVPMRGYKNITADMTEMNLVKQHVLFCSTPTQKHERIALLGGALDMYVSSSQFDSDVITIDNAMHTNRVAYIIPPVVTIPITEYGASNAAYSQYYDPSTILNGTTPSTSTPVTAFDGSYLAAGLSGIITNPTTDEAEPITHKQLSGPYSVIEYGTTSPVVLHSEEDYLAGHGTLVMDQDAPGSDIYVVQALTTDMTDPVTQELKVTRIADVLAKDLRVALNPSVGIRNRGASTLAAISNVVNFVLNQKIQDNIIVSAKNLQVVVDPQEPRQIDISFQILPDLDVDWLYVSFGVSST